MNRTRIAVALSLSLSLISAASIHADVKSDQKTLVKFEGMLGRVVNLFGGKSAREGIKTTTIVQGDRKVSLTGNSGEIIDLGEEKIYELDLRDKTYKVTTFEELRRQMEEAEREAEEAQREAEKEARHEPSEPAQEPDADQKEVEVDFDVKETGAKKTINGFDTRQVIMTIAMREKGKTLEESGGLVLTTDMWLAPTIAALDEIAEFDLRYAKQLDGPMLPGASAEQLAAAFAAHPSLQQGLERMREESVNMEGTPITTTLTVEAVKSAEMLAAEKEQSADSQPAASGGVGGLLGGFARRAAKKEPEAPKARATFMTTTNEVLSVSTSVSPADVAIPQGFREKK